MAWNIRGEAAFAETSLSTATPPTSWQRGPWLNTLLSQCKISLMPVPSSKPVPSSPANPTGVETPQWHLKASAKPLKLDKLPLKPPLHPAFHKVDFFTLDAYIPLPLVEIFSAESLRPGMRVTINDFHMKQKSLDIHAAGDFVLLPDGSLEGTLNLSGKGLAPYIQALIDAKAIKSMAAMALNFLVEGLETSPKSHKGFIKPALTKIRISFEEGFIWVNNIPVWTQPRLFKSSVPKNQNLLAH